MHEEQVVTLQAPWFQEVALQAALGIRRSKTSNRIAIASELEEKVNLIQLQSLAEVNVIHKYSHEEWDSRTI